MINNSFLYEIKIDDETGRPYIKLPDDYEDKAEDKFMAIQLCTYLLNEVYEKRYGKILGEFGDDEEKVKELTDSDEFLAFDITLDFLNDVAESTGDILMEQMKSTAEMKTMLNNSYLFQVNSYDDLKNVKPKNNLFGGSLYDRFDGMKVRVVDEDCIYVYDNDKWKKK